MVVVLVVGVVRLYAAAGRGSPEDPAERRTTAFGARQVYRAIENAWRAKGRVPSEIQGK